MAVLDFNNQPLQVGDKVYIVILDPNDPDSDLDAAHGTVRRLQDTRAAVWLDDTYYSEAVLVPGHKLVLDPPPKKGNWYHVRECKNG